MIDACPRCGRISAHDCPSVSCELRRDEITRQLVEDAVARGDAFTVYGRAKALTGDAEFAVRIQNEARAAVEASFRSAPSKEGGEND